jgi:ribosome biogenesis GTPase A
MQRHRRKPYSGKKKKQYLQEKRARKQQKENEENEREKEKNSAITFSNTNTNANATTTKREQSRKGSGVRRSTPMTEVPRSERLRTVFEREPRSEVEARIIQAKQPLRRVVGQQTVPESIYNTEVVIPIPTRPPWNYNMTKEEVERNEREAFEVWLHDVYRTYSRSRLNYFEHNLEVWRQLWRVCETSDILCVLADIRHPLFHFPPALYRYVVKQLGKPMVLLLTKADLVPRQNIDAWRQYFASNFAGLPVAAFCSFHKQVSDNELQQRGHKVKTQRRRRVYNPSGVREFLNICQSFGIKKRGEVVYFADYTPPFMCEDEEFTNTTNDLTSNSSTQHKQNTTLTLTSTSTSTSNQKSTTEQLTITSTTTKKRRRRKQKQNEKNHTTQNTKTQNQQKQREQEQEEKQKQASQRKARETKRVKEDNDNEEAEAEAEVNDEESDQDNEVTPEDAEDNDNDNDEDEEIRTATVSDSEAESDVESDEDVRTLKDDDDDDENPELRNTPTLSTSSASHERPYVTIGLIGHPNVGKSSVVCFFPSFPFFSFVRSSCCCCVQDKRTC